MLNLFNKSVYCCVRGSIIEVPLSDKITLEKALSCDTGNTSVTYRIEAQSDWIVDYTGNVIKNRRPERLNDIINFLNTGRKADFVCTNQQEIQNTVSLIVKCVTNYYNKGIKPGE